MKIYDGCVTGKTLHDREVMIHMLGPESTHTEKPFKTPTKLDHKMAYTYVPESTYPDIKDHGFQIMELKCDDLLISLRI